MPASKKGVLETPSIQSLDRGLCILEEVARSSGPVPLGHLTDLLGIDRSSVFRLANTLRRRGFLANPVGGKDYILGPAVWRLARRHGNGNILATLCRGHLKTLANRTGETTHLAVREGKLAFFVDHYASPNQIIVVSGQSGETVPLYCTAHGKALLADFDAAALKTLFGPEPLESHTPQTLVTIPQLAKACAQIKATGYAIDESEYREEVRCLAAPIRDRDGSIAASIGISAPVTRFPASRNVWFAAHVCETAAAVTALLSTEETA